MYEELIKSLRICGDWTEQVRLVGRDCCDGCKYKKDGVCESFKGNKELLLIEAADAIERLADENTRLVTTANGLSKMYDKLVDEMPDGWTPVTERLPKKDGWYLVSDGFNSWTAMFWGKETVWTGNFNFGLAGITHWMPLPKTPQPPKEET